MNRKSSKVFVLKPFGQQSSQSGMNLIEIIIVVALLGTLMAILIRNLTGQQEEVMKDQARIAMGQLSSDLQIFKVHNFSYPNNEQGLDALVSDPGSVKNWRGPYTEEKKLEDPWGERYEYESDGSNYKIISGGPNKSVGDEDDIFYPEEANDFESGDDE